ncbi:hypothetical protein FA95DRAFT_1464079, partial [Auriscalpium vulgare]
IREALVKICEEKIGVWPEKLAQVMFADRITVTKSTGFSPYFLIHGVHPVLPFDLTEATFMIDGYHSGLSPTELLVLRTRQLEKRPEDIECAAKELARHRFASKEQFERRFAKRMTTTEFSPGAWVLIRNTRVEKEMNRKHKPRYEGPFQVVRRTKGGSYVVKELSGTYMRNGIAAFRLVPY